MRVFDGSPLVSGTKGEQVTFLHVTLKELGYTIETAEHQATLFGPTTRHALLQFQRVGGLAVSGVVDVETFAALIDAAEVGGCHADHHTHPSVIVRGTVTWENGLPMGAAQVVVGAIALGGARVLVRTRTDASGGYDVGLRRSDLHGDGPLDDGIVVTVQDARGKTLVQSAPAFRVGAILSVNLTVPAAVLQPPTEIEGLESAVDKALAGVAMAKLTDDQLALLAAQINRSVEELRALADAERGTTAALPKAFLYACARQGLSAQPAQLAQLPAATITATCATAAAGGTVPAFDDGVVKAAVAALARLRLGALTTPSTQSQRAAIGDILTLAVSDSATRTTVAQAVVAHGLDSNDFWQALKQTPGVTAGQTQALRNTVAMSRISAGYLPFLRYLVESYKPSGPRSLVNLDVPALVQMLSTPRNGQPIGAPQGTPGSTLAEQTQAYARSVQATIIAAYPTPAFAVRVAADGLPAKKSFQADMLTFFGANPDFELTQHSIMRYVRDNPGCLRGITSSRAQFLDEMGTVQRIFRLAPCWEHVQALLDSGLHSARAISRKGRGRFLQQFDKSLGMAAASIYDRANHVTALLAHLHAQDQERVFESSIGTLQDGALNVAARQAQEELFGSLDMCGCPDCRSVLSPAAYLTDLFSWLDQRPSAVVNMSALSVLFDSGDGTVSNPGQVRRPDLQYIQLSCINTDTPLPYIDLVNEILEQAVAPQSIDPTQLQTTLPADQLSVSPEHVNENAYATLLATFFPMDLPFDLHTSEARVFLNGMGATREELLAATFPGDRAAALADGSTVEERLGLPDLAWNIVVTADPTQITPSPIQPWALWGMAAEQVPDPGATGSNPPTIDWFVALRYVPVFLQQAAIEYSDLLALLRSRFMTADGTTAPTLTPSSPCDLDTAVLVGLDAAYCTRAHRLLRLWRAVHAVAGWSIDDLDLALTTLASTDLAPANLTAMAMIVRLQKQVSALSLARLLTFWGEISTRQPPGGGASPYDQLFQNPAIVSPLMNPTLFNAFALNGSRTDLATPGGTISDAAIKPMVLAALGLGDDDLKTILGNGPGQVADSLSLANLSAIVRLVTLANLPGPKPLLAVASPGGASRVSYTYLLALLALTSSAPFASPFASPTDTIDWLATLQSLQASGFDVPTVLWLTEGSIPAGATAALPDSSITSTLTTLQQRLQAAVADNPAVPIDHLAQLVQKAVWPLVQFPTDPTTGYPVTLVSDLCTAPGHPSTSMLDLLLTLKDSGGLDPTSSAAIIAIRRLQVIGVLAKTLALLSADLPYLFNRSLAQPPFPAQPVTQAPATIVAGLGWLDPNGIPTATVAADPTTLDALLRLCSAVHLCATSGCALVDLYTIFEDARANSPQKATVLADILTALKTQVPASGTAPATFIPWLQADLEALTANNAPFSDGASGFPTAFADERGLVRLKRCFDLLHLYGVPASRMLAWAVTPVPSAKAADIRVAARAGFTTEAAWLAVAQPWQDSLRGQQRDALVSDLLGQRLVADLTASADTAELVAQYLIDVEMGPCRMASRIQQAISSTQMFIQRAMMKLEPLVAFSDEDQQQWKWMQNYQVSAANRNVFLYPEDWVVPELRDDKTPFFKDLEQALLQGEITSDNAETAVKQYVTSLRDVAHLEICGMYHQVERAMELVTYHFGDLEIQLPEAVGPVTTDVLHIIGRTRSRPATYYYRTWVDQSRWTAWEKIPLSIDSDHLIPVVWNRRLRLCWVTVKQTADLGAPAGTRASGSSISSAKPPQVWQLALHWSVYHDGTWSAPASATDPDQVIEAPATPYGNAPHVAGRDWAVELERHFAFQGQIIDDALWIICYAHVAQWDPSLGWPSKPGYYVWGKYIFPACDGRMTTYGNYARGYVNQPFQPVASGWRANQSIAIPQPGSLTLAEGGGFSSVLASLPFPDVLVSYAHQYMLDPFPGPFFIDDDERTFFAMPILPPDDNTAPPPALAPPEPPDNPQPYNGPDYPPDVLAALSADSMMMASGTDTDPAYRQSGTFQFWSASHPWACTFLEALERGGLDVLYRRWIQVAPWIQDGGFITSSTIDPEVFNDSYGPQGGMGTVAAPYPISDVDFSYGGAYSVYNWELFFHIPIFIAKRLKDNLQFEDALHWLQRVFDPTDTSGLPAPHRFWRTRPFFDAGAAQSIQGLLALLDNTGQPEPQPLVDDLNKQLTAWRNHPFNPHLIARMRPGAYQKATLMQYLDTLIAWGDQLFMQNQIESINEATLMYLAAASLLGPRPPEIPPQTTTNNLAFADMRDNLDAFDNYHVGGEQIVPVPVGQGGTPSPSVGLPAPVLPIMYFCLPPSPKLMGAPSLGYVSYWDTLADRLTKIRNCEDITGQAEQLPLFAPPIDPALLVEATAAGLSIADVLTALSAPPPIFRFEPMVKHAHEMINRVIALGAKLLSALERHDARALELLKSGNELSLMALIRGVKSQQVDEAQQRVDALTFSQQIQQEIEDYYRSKLPATLVADYIADAVKGLALLPRGIGASAHVMAALLAGIPDLSFGIDGLAVTFAAKEKPADFMKEAAQAATQIAVAMIDGATLIKDVASQVRAKLEWDLKADQAKAQFDEIGKQLIAANTALAIREAELANYDAAIANAQAVDDFYRNQQFTTEDLYGWLIGQVSALYFQAYQVAYGVAQQAERAFREELGIFPLAKHDYITFGYWDSLHKGLLAGEALQLDVSRMEAAYYQKRQRLHEITKKISLNGLGVLTTLANSGTCTFSLTKALFDSDYPNHYLRRIAAVNLVLNFANPDDAISTSAVACTLTLVNDEIDDQSGTPVPQQYSLPESMVASTGQALTARSENTNNKGQNVTYTGVFVLDFLKDERFFPFEGRGAISDWKVTLSSATQALLNPSKDKNGNPVPPQVTDVFIQVKYTAMG